MSLREIKKIMNKNYWRNLPIRKQILNDNMMKNKKKDNNNIHKISQIINWNKYWV